MEDEEIVALYWQRREEAISESGKKYGPSCVYVARRILNDREEAREAENDTYLAAWNTIPPQKPLPLLPYLAMLCRRIAIDRLRTRTRRKRGGGQYELLTTELDEAGNGGAGVEDEAALRDTLERFLADLRERQRLLFLRRYWWGASIGELALDFGMTPGAVKMELSRAREKLRAQLNEEGYL